MEGTELVGAVLWEEARPSTQEDTFRSAVVALCEDLTHHAAWWRWPLYAARAMMTGIGCKRCAFGEAFMLKLCARCLVRELRSRAQHWKSSVALAQQEVAAARAVNLPLQVSIRAGELQTLLQRTSRIALVFAVEASRRRLEATWGHVLEATRSAAAASAHVHRVPRRRYPRGVALLVEAFSFVDRQRAIPVEHYNRKLSIDDMSVVASLRSLSARWGPPVTCNDRLGVAVTHEIPIAGVVHGFLAVHKMAAHTTVDPRTHVPEWFDGR